MSSFVSIALKNATVNFEAGLDGWISIQGQRDEDVTGNTDIIPPPAPAPAPAEKKMKAPAPGKDKKVKKKARQQMFTKGTGGKHKKWHKSKKCYFLNSAAGVIRRYGAPSVEKLCKACSKAT